MTTKPYDKERRIPPLRAGLFTGSIAGIIAVLVNLPLNSPSDAFFNSAPVMVASLLAGVGAGFLRHALGDSSRSLILFMFVMALVFVLVSAAAVAGESQMERSVSYIVPLAAIVLGLTGLLTVLLLRIKKAPSWKLTLLMIVIVVGFGIGLAGHGDQESGRLELPPRTSRGLYLMDNYYKGWQWSYDYG